METRPLQPSSTVRPRLSDAKKIPPGLQRLEEDLVAHIFRYFAHDTRGLGKEQAASLARLGVLRAGWHGINKVGAVHQYINMMMLLGSEFDMDPQLPWVRSLAARNAQGLASAMAEIAQAALKQRLLDRDLAQLDRVKFAEIVK